MSQPHEFAIVHVKASISEPLRPFARFKRNPIAELREVLQDEEWITDGTTPETYRCQIEDDIMLVVRIDAADQATMELAGQAIAIRADLAPAVRLKQQQRLMAVEGKYRQTVNSIVNKTITLAFRNVVKRHPDSTLEEKEYADNHLNVRELRVQLSIPS